MRHLRFAPLGLLALAALLLVAHNPLPASAEAATAVTAGGAQTCALTTNGGVKCWGQNIVGELGDGTTTSSTTPVDVVGLGTGVTAVATGANHACAVTTAGGVKCWGINFFGQLGDGTIDNFRTAPVDVCADAACDSALSGVVAVAAYNHTCALTTAGAVKCWGRNSDGQLGNGTSGGARTSPVDVVGLASGAEAITAGGSHTCTVTMGHAVKCWGRNNRGQLGDGTGANRNSPVDVVGLGSGVVGVAAGFEHTCALTAVGGVKCWGGGPSFTPTPVDVVGLGSGVIAVAAGGEHNCALTAVGGVKCWGNNFFGQLGDGTTTNRATPVDVLEEPGGPPLGGVAAIAAGVGHTCALVTAGGIKCWGDNNLGKLGDGTITDRATPVDVVGLSGVVTVDIDVKPGSDPNSTNLGSHGVIPVAILTTDTFDAATVDPATVVFARPDGAAPVHDRLEDVDADGDLDLIMRFRTQETNIEDEATEACLSGETLGGQAIEGCDTIRIVPPWLDSDGDSLGLGDPFGLFFGDAAEATMGTDQFAACSTSPTHAAWPLDFTNDQDVDGSDLFLFAERFGTELGVPPPIGKQPYIVRFDIYPTAASLNKIDGSDLFVLASYFGDSCP